MTNHQFALNASVISGITGLDPVAPSGVRRDVSALDIVYAAIDEVNMQAGDDGLVRKSPDTLLMGGEGSLDSLAFVNLVVAVENEIQRRTHKSVVLVNEQTLEGDEHPFRTVGTLANLIDRLLA